MAIIDVTTFNGEFDLFELRYHMLKDIVDEFIVCEARTTFSGLDKPLYGEATDVFYDPISQWPKVKYHVIDENWTEEEKLVAWASPNVGGAAHWTREFLQKESIKKALTHLKDEDIVFIGDVDEIWSPQALKLLGTFKLKLRVYTYYLNNRSSEVFYGPIKAPYGAIKDLILNHVRTNAIRTKNYYGWHFTSMQDQLARKLTDSYTQESYATPEVLANLAYNIEHNQDFLGRDFTYELDETDWPDYLTDNREKYRELCK